MHELSMRAQQGEPRASLKPPAARGASYLGPADLSTVEANLTALSTTSSKDNIYADAQSREFAEDIHIYEHLPWPRATGLDADMGSTNRSYVEVMGSGPGHDMETASTEYIEVNTGEHEAENYQDPVIVTYEDTATATSAGPEDIDATYEN